MRGHRLASSSSNLLYAAWTGVAGAGFQGNVCRSVVGQAKADATTFYAELCIPEHDYREISPIFDRVGLNLVLSSD